MHIAKVPEALHFASAISALGRSSEWERSVSLWQDVKATRAWVSQFGMIRIDLIYIYKYLGVILYHMIPLHTPYDTSRSSFFGCHSVPKEKLLAELTQRKGMTV